MQEAADVLLTTEMWWIVAILLHCNAVQPIEYVCRLQGARCSHPYKLRHILRDGMIRSVRFITLFFFASFSSIHNCTYMYYIYIYKKKRKEIIYLIFFYIFTLSHYISHLFFSNFHDTWYCILWFYIYICCLKIKFFNMLFDYNFIRD